MYAVIRWCPRCKELGEESEHVDCIAGAANKQLYVLTTIADVIESPHMKTVADILKERAEKAEQGPWVPANGGTEVPFFTRGRKRLLYCWQPSTGKHAYLDCDSDIILTDDEAQLYLSK